MNNKAYVMDLFPPEDIQEDARKCKKMRAIFECARNNNGGR